jgi:S1-C subfamily serine protease
MGVDKGDFIREINGKKIKNVKDLLNILDNVPLSVDKYHITIEKNGELIDFSVNR